MSFIAVGTATSIGFSLWSGSQQKKAAKKAGKASAAAYEFQAKMHELDAAYNDRSNLMNQGIMAESAERETSSIVAKMGKSGVSLSSVSSQTVLSTALKTFAQNKDLYMDEMMIKSRKMRTSAELSRMNAKAALEGGQAAADTAWAQTGSNIAGTATNYFLYNSLYGK